MSNVIAFPARKAVDSDDLRDSRHPHARAARDQAAWLLWLKLGRTADRTLHDYQWATDFLLERYPRKTFQEFTAQDITRVLLGFPERSRRVRLAAFKSWFKWGIQQRLLERNPIDLLPEIKRQPYELVVVFTLTEIEMLTSLPSPDGYLMTVLFEIGLRKSEARHLQRRHFDYDRGQVLVMEGTKGGKHRAVPMTPTLVRAIEDLFALEGVNEEDYLWSHKPGGGKVQRNRPIGNGSFHRWWVNAVTDAGVAYRKPHTTRHTFATVWRQRGLALDDIQLLLGHASLSTTSDLYVHRNVGDVAERMASLRAS